MKITVDGGSRVSMVQVKLVSEIDFGMNWLVYRFYVVKSGALEEISMWLEACKRSSTVIEPLQAWNFLMS